MLGVPWWCVIMPSAFSLARWLSRQDLRGVRVLEVGCGSGISGLAAAMAGADVLVTDRQPAALELALRNARRNGVRMKAAAADWRDWPVHGRFDCVIGSDITYESSVFEALLHVLEHALVPGGEVLLADPGRPATAAFRRRVLDAGWAWESFHLPKESVIAGESSEAIYLHHLRPPH